MDAEQIIIKTPILMYPEAKDYFQEHGCQIKMLYEYYEVICPAGTRREERWPRPAQSAVYQLIFPDGAQALEQYIPYMQMSLLFYSSSASPS